MSNTLECLKGQFREQKEHLDFRFDTLEKSLEKMEKKDKEQDERISSLEGSRWWIRGAVAVVVLILSVLGIKGWFKF